MSTNGTKDLRKGYEFINLLQKNFLKRNQDINILTIGNEKKY